MVFIFYLFNVLSELSKNVEFMKYFSVYTLADIRNILAKTAINPIMILISIIITLVFTICTYMRYNRKELI